MHVRGCCGEKITWAMLKICVAGLDVGKWSWTFLFCVLADDNLQPHKFVLSWRLWWTLGGCPWRLEPCVSGFCNLDLEIQILISGTAWGAEFPFWELRKKTSWSEGEYGLKKGCSLDVQRILVCWQDINLSRGEAREHKRSTSSVRPTKGFCFQYQQPR